MKQNVLNHDTTLSSNHPAKAKCNRHISVLYGIQYSARAPLANRCKQTQYECFANKDKKQIFTLVHKFVKKILDSPDQLDKVFKEIQFVDNWNVATTIPEEQFQFKINVIEEKPVKVQQLQLNVCKKFICDESNNFLLTADKKEKASRKTSIMIDGVFVDFDFEFDSKRQEGSEIFSDQDLPCLSLIKVCQQQFNQDMVQMIYEQPQPSLINLSICLMLKFLYYSRIRLTPQNVCWILSIGTIIAYKIYYDEPVQGLISSFSYILKIKKEDTINLQREFLAQINHQAVISNQQYHQVLYQMIKQ